MRIAEIARNTKVDGPGDRIAVFVQGCSIRCSGCQNRHLWSSRTGYHWLPGDLAFALVKSGLPITISGGEPFDQPRSLAALLAAVRELDPLRHVILYTGYELRELLRTGDVDVLQALSMIDVLVDGPYVQELDAPGMQYRGSSNQQVIDMPATLARPAREVLTEGPVTLDWDTPELILTGSGDLLAATPLAVDFSDLGDLVATRRCGQT